MIIASLTDYLPLGDLGKIVAVCLMVAVVAPTAVWVGIVGLERRNRAVASGSGRAAGTVLVIVGVAVLLSLVAAGIYALDVH